MAARDNKTGRRAQEHRPRQQNPPKPDEEIHSAFDDEEPLSLAEEIVERDLHRKDENDRRYEQIKHSDDTHIAELQRMTMPELIEEARKENLSDYHGIKKQDLIFLIEQDSFFVETFARIIKKGVQEGVFRAQQPEIVSTLLTILTHSWALKRYTLKKYSLYMFQKTLVHFILNGLLKQQHP